MFLTILGMVILYVAGTNVSLKQLNKKGKISFYTAESIVDEVYTGLGMESMDSLSDAYTYVLSNRTVTKKMGSILYTSEEGNEEANQLLRKRFIIGLVSEATGKNGSGVNYYNDTEYNRGSIVTYSKNETGLNADMHKKMLENAAVYLSGKIKSPTTGKVTSVGSIQITHIEDSVNKVYDYKVLFKDVTMQFKGGKEDYFSYVTVDYNVEYPDINVVFKVDNKKYVDAFKDYLFIATNQVEFNGVSSTTYGGIYAGDTNGTTTNGISLIDSNVRLNSGKGTISTLGDIKISNTATGTANVSFTNSKIWAQNIKVNNERSKNSTVRSAQLTIDAGCSTYLRDDLQVEANNATINISGNYQGYSYGPGTGDAMSVGGYKQDTESGSPNAQSAIIINGKNTVLNMTDINNLVLAGKAYIVYSASSTGSTAESVGLKGNQRYYLLPDKYLKATSNGLDVKVAQPMNTNIYGALSTYGSATGLGITWDDTNIREFFGYQFLDDTKPIKLVTAGRFVYANLNFKNNKSANEYLKCLLDEAYFRATVNGGAPTAAQVDSWNDMSVLTAGFLQNLQSSTSISFAGGATVGTHAMLLEYGSSTFSDGSAGASGTWNEIDMQKISQNDAARYGILNHVLVSYSDSDNVDPQPGSYINELGEPVKIPNGSADDPYNAYERNVFNNIIDEDELEASPLMLHESDGEYILFDYTSSLIKVPVNARYGVIVANGSVEISSDFTGIIISNNKIFVKGGATYTNNIHSANATYTDIRDYLERANGGDLVKYFLALKGAYSFGNEEENKIGNIEYTDLVTYSNWRKTTEE